MNDDPLVGRRVAGHVLLRPLGEGGMARVYLARQERLNRLVAFKILGAEQYDEEERLARFRREIEACTSLSHPNVVKVFDAGTIDGTLWYSMEHVEGHTLEDPARAGLDDLDAILRVGRDLADALAVIHERGMVHRDLKPANVMVDRSGSCRLMDFGLVSLAERTAITKEGDVLGTLMFMPPEGVAGRDVGPAGDVYAFGLTLYWLVARSYPFPCEDVNELCTAVLMQPVPPLAEFRGDLPEGLSDLVARCVAKDPEERPVDGRALLREMEALCESRWQPALRLGEVAPPGAEASGAFSRPAEVLAPEGREPSTAKLFLLGLFVGMLVIGLGAVLHRIVAAPLPTGRNWDFEGEGGHRGLAVTWRSEHAYPSVVEVEDSGGGLRRAEGSTATDRHRAVVTGLEPGREHRWRIVYPDGSRSIWRSGRTWSREELLRVSRKLVPTERGLRLLLSFRAPVSLRLEALSGGRTVRRVEAAPADRSHSLLLTDAPGFDGPVTFRGRIETVAGEDFELELEAVPSLGALLAEEARAEAVQAWVGRFYDAGKGEGEGAKGGLDRLLERFRRSRLHGLVHLARPGLSAHLLDERVPLERRIALLNVVQDVDRIDQVLAHWTRRDAVLGLRKALQPILRVEAHFPAPPIRSRTSRKLIELPRDGDLFVPANTPKSSWRGLERMSSVLMPAMSSQGMRILRMPWKADVASAIDGQALAFALCIGRRDFPNHYVLSFANGLQLHVPKPGGLRGDQSISELFVMAGGRDLLRDSLSALAVTIHRSFLPAVDGSFSVELRTYVDWVLFPDVLRSIWLGPEGGLFDLPDRGW